ncbi:hypothetical protein [Flavobacterium humidisoli]|uniref:Immunity protein 50 n=1 Tax=Flavobacterium humidisoli TaxID=2937442 RepID=A0ABY4LXU9_9FLAO|nr:hypothetical protein [Flavobacterium humidisoli]UPZ17901.1 hypothetical protein M0M44_11245 [Flavobacterium humidisoli]
MYTINTQLVYFKYSLYSKKILVNVKWFKLEGSGNFNLQALSFNEIEIVHFKAFIDRHKDNFPGGQFVESSNLEGFNIPLINELSKTAVPFYLILSKQSDLNLNKNIYQTANIVLMDKNYESEINCTLDFGVIGKIEIYKELTAS